MRAEKTYKATVARLTKEVAQLKRERLLLAKLAHAKYQFFNPIDAWEAKELCDRILSDEHAL